MKILHCADIHLDSPMTANFPEKLAEERRSALLRSFLDMIEFASEEGVTAVLIAGDLFDSAHVSATTTAAIRRAVCRHTDLLFAYLRGNHDAAAGGEDLIFGGEVPENWLTFTDRWQSYRIPDDLDDGHHVLVPVILTARELADSGGKEAADTLHLKESAFNIVMLHGQQAQHGGTIPLDRFQGKNIDYLALGHVHHFGQGRIDGRGIWCCPGCLLGRGFDETGETGFVLLDIDTETGKMSRSFIADPGGRFEEIRVDVTGCHSSAEMEERISDRIASLKIRPEDYLRVILSGELDVEAEFNLTYLRKAFENQFRSFELRDETAFHVDAEAYRYEPTLRGELVRLLAADDGVPEERKAEIIRCAMEMLGGNQ